MPDNKKYYYIKLKDNYFDQDNIKILEAMDNGYIYSLIILKLYLKSSKYNGRLMMTTTIPYDPKKLSILANVIGHDVAHIKDALSYAKELDLISILDTGEIWMTDIQNFIGNSSTEADRIREYRTKLKSTAVQMYDKCTPELKIEREREREKEKEKDPIIPFNPIETPNTGLSDRIQATIEYWNELAKDHDCIPHYRYNMFQIKDYQGVKRTMGAVTDEEACHAIDTYIEIFENTSDYKCFPNGYSFEGFIKSGVDQYCDSAKPWTRCAIEQGSDPRVKFKSKIWDD